LNVKRLRFPIGIAAILGAIGWLVLSSTASTGAYYVTVTELFAKGDIVKGRPLRVSGHVVTGSIQRETQRAELRFQIADPGNPDRTLPVIYRHAAVPDTFKDGAEAVVEGRISAEGVFEAKTLFAKCPSKYEAKQPPTGPVSS
jgi:cytochrome c-type biogenesis protein CcmE